MPKAKPALLLYLIVFAQFAGTSLWFAGNAVMDVFSIQLNITVSSITAAVQLGFIAGTLFYSILRLADRFNSAAVFFYSSLLAAALNLCLLFQIEESMYLYSIRFGTGFFLAGIYPVGMKIATDLFPEKMGKALGLLVGALVLGTAFPHFIKAFSNELSFKTVIITVSIMAVIGGIMIMVFLPSSSQHGRNFQLRFKGALQNFTNIDFRESAYGYFGHMWELYAFWAFVPIIIQLYNLHHQLSLSISLYSFIIIAIGSLSCACGGFLSQKFGSKKVAFTSLHISLICSLLSPFIFMLPILLFIAFLIVWSAFVISDSPQFSALVAKTAIPQTKGTILTLVTSIGFLITVLSLGFLQFALQHFGTYAFAALGLGPLLSLIFYYKNL